MTARSFVVCWGLKKALTNFSPELVVVIGAGKLFPSSVLAGPENRNHRLIALFGDNSDFSHFNSVRSKLLQHIIRKRVYRKAICSCDRIYLYTPETEEILLSYLRGNLRDVLKQKRVSSTLGYDQDEFYFDATERFSARKRLNIIDDEVIFITSTRVTRLKKIEKAVAAVTRMYVDGLRVRYFIVGFLGDSYGERLRFLIGKQPNPGIFHTYPFLHHDKVRQLYCASDIGVWTKTAISIQEGMGTGLPVIIALKPGLKHLIQGGVDGWFFEEENLHKVMEEACSTISAKSSADRIRLRKALAVRNLKELSYDKIASDILKTL